MSIFEELWRKPVFFGGDVRRLHSFPYVTWAVHEHQVGCDEVIEVLPLIKYGNI